MPNKSMSQKEVRRLLLRQAGVTADLSRYPDRLTVTSQSEDSLPVDRDKNYLYLEGVITADAEFFRMFGIPALDAVSVRDGLAELSGDLTIFINSPGGEIPEGAAIRTAIMDRAATDKVRTVASGWVASMAVPILLGANDGIYINEMGIIMVHRASTAIYGDCNDMLEAADLLEKLDKMDAKLIGKRVGGTEKALEYIDAETYFSPDEALEVGLVDGLWEEQLEAEKETPRAEAKRITAERIEKIRKVVQRN